MFKALVKANDDLISHCRCETAYATGGQADCPWCGCGWLFTCLTCGKAFTFAKVVCAEVSPQELARQDVRNWGLEPEELEPEDFAEFVASFERWVADREVGETCVYLDGSVFGAAQENIAFDGEKSRHDLARLPQVEALFDRAALDRTIGNIDYWLAREIGAHGEPDDPN